MHIPFHLIKPFLPVFVTGAVILGCATGPVLEAIPPRQALDLQAIEALQVTPSPTPSPSPSPSPEGNSASALSMDSLLDIPEEVQAEPLVQAVGNYTDGVYTGSGMGYGGQIRVSVTVAGGQIVSVEILSAPGETEPFLTRAKGVIDSILRAQTWEVDAVSEATYSSSGIKAAVCNALTGQTVTASQPQSTSPGARPVPPPRCRFPTPSRSAATGTGSTPAPPRALAAQSRYR